jgi:anti-anti-sigma factor
MPINVTIQNNKLVMAFPSRMDTVACKEVEQDAQNRIAGWRGPIAFDLKGVMFIASAFLRICMAAAKQVGSENFTFINVEPPVKLVLKTAGFDQFIADR